MGQKVEMQTEQNITEISLSPGKICRRVIPANVGNTNGISVQIKIFQRNSGLGRMPIEKGRKLVEGGEVRRRLQDVTSRTVCTTLQRSPGHGVRTATQDAELKISLRIRLRIVNRCLVGAVHNYTV